MRGTISAFVYSFFKCINEPEVINEGDRRGKDLHAQCLNYFPSCRVLPSPSVYCAARRCFIRNDWSYEILFIPPDTVPSASSAPGTDSACTMNSENILKSDYKLPASGVPAWFFSENSHHVCRLSRSYRDARSLSSCFWELRDSGVQGCHGCVRAPLPRALVNGTGASNSFPRRQPPQEVVAAEILPAQHVFLAFSNVLCSSHHDIRISLCSRAAFPTVFWFVDG